MDARINVELLKSPIKDGKHGSKNNPAEEDTPVITAHDERSQGFCTRSARTSVMFGVAARAANVYGICAALPMRAAYRCIISVHRASLTHASYSSRLTNMASCIYT